MKRILQIHDTDIIKGGAEHHLLGIAKLLRENDYEVYTFKFSNYTDCHIQSSQMNYVFVEPPKFRRLKGLLISLDIIKKLRAFIEYVKPDFILIHNNYKYPFSVLSALRGYKVFQIVHDYQLINWLKGESIFLYLRQLIYNRIVKNWFRFLAPSYRLNQELKKKGLDSHHIGYYFNYSGWKFDISKTEPRTILFIGALNHNKGAMVLLKAVNLIKYIMPNINVNIIGTGKMEKELREYASTELKNVNVTFFGSIPNNKIKDFLYKATVLIAPSIWEEMFGRVGLEAMSCGTPCIGSNIGGIPEWIIHNRTGLLFEPNNHKDLAEQIYKIIQCPKLAKYFSQTGRVVIENRYKKKEYLKRFIKNVIQ